jgi:hypothetical protein
MPHGATAHTAWLSMNTLCAAFPGPLLSWFGDIHWPSNSPDLTAADFFLWGYLKAQFLLTPSLTLTALKMQFLRRLRMLRRTQQCLDCHGGQLQDVVLKTWGFFYESKTLTYLTVFRCIYCCVQQMCYPTFKMGNVKCHTLYKEMTHTVVFFLA